MTAISIDELPWPGEELVSRVATGVDRDEFFNSGRQSVVDLGAALGVIGREIKDYHRILDFGCGCGRVLMWLHEAAADAELYGVDIDERAIEWDREHLPFAQFERSNDMPPLDFPDGHFDLVFCHSVFTHIPEDMQDAWLAELRRVTRPGGHLFLTVHGEHCFAGFERDSQEVGDPARVRRILETEGIAYIPDDCFVGSTHPEYYHSTFHAPWYIYAHWSRWLEVKAHIPQGSLGFQDAILFERPQDGAERCIVPPAIGSLRVEEPPPPPPAQDPGIVRLEQLAEGPDIHSPTRYGVLAHATRRTMQRLMRHYTNHQRELSLGMVRTLGSLAERIGAIERWSGDFEKRAGVPGGHVYESIVRLRTTIQQQGERMNRLERDVFDAVKRIEERVDRPAGGRQAPRKDAAR